MQFAPYASVQFTQLHAGMSSNWVAEQTLLQIKQALFRLHNVHSGSISSQWLLIALIPSVKLKVEPALDTFLVITGAKAVTTQLMTTNPTMISTKEKAEWV